MRDHDVRIVTIIEPPSPRRPVDWRALWEYRDLFLLLIWRNIRTRYAQSAIGIGWAVLQPVATMLVFSIVFGNLVGVKSDGVPYPIFAFVALVPWAYFSSALSGATGSLVGHADMIRKIYFPRLLLPMSMIGARLVDFLIALAILALLMAVYGRMPNSGILALPLLVFVMILTASGLGLWLTALAIQYRDVNYSIGLIVQIILYATPVIYPASLIPQRYHLLYALNPMVGVVEGFRAGFLGTRPMPWDLLAIGAVVGSLCLYTGVRYFQAREHVFADVA
jgi:lipopolysaccharide transport system permease protein